MTAVASAMASCASCASFNASAFSCLPTCRISVASFTNEVMSDTMSSASPMAICSCAMMPLFFSMATRSLSILLVLSPSEMLLLLISWSHQSLWLSSFFCSSMRRKIIFSIELITWSKASKRRELSSSARRESAFECDTRAALRRRFTARSLGSSASCRKLTGEAGGTGLLGASVRTPAAFARILTAAAMASRSLARTAERSCHSRSLTPQFFSVVARVSLSAVRSSSSDALSFLSPDKSSRTVARAVSFSLFESSAASTSASLACFVRSCVLMAFVSAFTYSSSSPSNLARRALRSSMTSLDLKSYFWTWASRSPLAFSTGLPDCCNKADNARRWAPSAASALPSARAPRTRGRSRTCASVAPGSRAASSSLMAAAMAWMVLLWSVLLLT
mmetsp:Transcript_50295/g.139653  ORF Transcript_50295/g.139653 Transcript_50295/m.139653 type:complete len:391 (+) Transcript_50295:34-1206(+)